MGRWGDLPNEIITMIADEVLKGDSSNHYAFTNGWMIVNRQMYDLYQSGKYKEVAISFNNPTNMVFNNILHSRFQPGRFVKHIVINNLNPPSSLYNINPAVDPLHLLMNCCPNVESVELRTDYTHSADAWAYFTISLTNTGIWKLHSLPTLHHKMKNFIQYYHCAFYSRHSLRKLTLTQGMIGKVYETLKEFKELATLHIDENVVKNLDDFYKLIQYLPNLKDVEITFPESQQQNGEEINTTTDGGDSSGLVRKTYPNIQKIKIRNYIPYRDEELLSIMEQFTNLDNFSIFVNCSREWPAATVSPQVTRSFFRFIHAVPTYEIKIIDIEDESQFINEYFDADKGTEQKACLSVELKSPENFLTPDTNSFIIKKCINDNLTVVEISYILGSESDAEISRARIFLGNMSDIFEEIVLFSEDKRQDDELLLLFNDLLATFKDRLLKLTLTGGTIYELPQVIQLRSIVHLVFRHADIYESEFPVLSAAFPHLKTMVLFLCPISIVDNYYDGIAHNKFEIRIPDSSLDILLLSATEGYEPISAPFVKPILFLFIDIVDRPGLAKFYMTSQYERNNVVEISRLMYEQFKNLLLEDQASFIYVYVKSIKTIEFESPQYNFRIESAPV